MICGLPQALQNKLCYLLGKHDKKLASCVKYRPDIVQSRFWDGAFDKEHIEINRNEKLNVMK